MSTRLTSLKSRHLLIILVVAASLTACGGGGSGGPPPAGPVVMPEPPPPPPEPGPGDPPPVFSPNIDADLGLYLYQGTSGGFYSPVLRDFIESSTLSILGVEWQGFAVREFAQVARPSGSDVTLDMVVAGDRFYWVRDAGFYFSVRRHDARDGGLIGSVEIFDRVGPCIAIAGDTLYYSNDDGFLKLSSFLGQGSVNDGELVTEDSPCGRAGIFNVDGELVVGDYEFPSASNPRVPIEFWRLDTATGTRDEMIARLQNADGALLDFNADHSTPRFALASDGIYVTVYYDEAAFELWWAPFAAETAADPTVAPQRLFRIDDPSAIDTELGGFDFRNLTGLWADDGFVAIALDFDVVADGSRTIEHRLLVVDTYGGDVDVLDPGNDVFKLRLLHFD